MSGFMTTVLMKSSGFYLFFFIIYLFIYFYLEGFPYGSRF